MASWRGAPTSPWQESGQDHERRLTAYRYRTIRPHSARRLGTAMSMRRRSQTHQNHTTMEREKHRDEWAARELSGLSCWRSSMVEQLICNQQVAGSSPIASSVVQCPNELDSSLGRVPERSKGTDCKSVATGFEGSNPSPSTAAMTGDEFAGVAQLVELQPSKLDVAGSRPVSRSNPAHLTSAHLAQLAEHVLGKDEVTRSIRVVGSRLLVQ